MRPIRLRSVLVVVFSTLCIFTAPAALARGHGNRGHRDHGYHDSGRRQEFSRHHHHHHHEYTRRPDRYDRRHRYGGPSRWAPAYGYRRPQHHRYHYYPSCGAYYQPATRQYFWLDGGAVQFGFRLPSGMRAGRSSIIVELDADRPDFGDFYR